MCKVTKKNTHTQKIEHFFAKKIVYPLYLITFNIYSPYFLFTFRFSVFL